MSRTMYDGIDAEQLPTDGWAVAGYVDGQWPDYEKLTELQPEKVHISITALGGRAKVADVEQGDITPDHAPGWAAEQREAGDPYPVVYCNASTWPAVREAFAAAGEPEPLYWIAEWNGDTVIPDGAIAKQYANAAGYDTSVVVDYWPGVDPAPAGSLPPSSPPAPAEGARVYRVQPRDTLSSIAAKFDIPSWQTLWDYNIGTGPGTANRPAGTILTLKDRGPDLLYAGEEIYIPPTAA